MTEDELKPHSAKHTLAFIEDEYVEKDDDATIILGVRFSLQHGCRRLVYLHGWIHSRSYHLDTARPSTESRMVDKQK